MSSFVLVTYMPNPRTTATRMAAALNGTKLDIRSWPIGEGKKYEWGLTPRKLDESEIPKEGYLKTAQFVEKTQFATAPALFTEDGSYGVCESVAQARLVARAGSKTRALYGKNDLEAAKIDAWIDKAQELHATAFQTLLPALGYAKFDPAHRTRCEAGVLRSLKTFEEHVGKAFLTGADLSVADLIMLGYLQVVRDVIMPADVFAKFPAVAAYMERVEAVPEIKDLAAADKQFYAGMKAKNADHESMKWTS